MAMWTRYRKLWPLLLVCSAVALPGCSPAVQPPPIGQTTQQTGTKVSTSVWTSILHSAELGDNARMYMVKSSANLIEGSIHSSFTVYGSVNPPSRAMLGFGEGNDYVEYYQQGKAAYARDNGQWTQTSALPGINPYDSYAQLIQSATSGGIPLYKLKDEYVVDEYCSVYKSTIPSGLVQAAPMFQSKIQSSQLGDLQYTFYVGQKSHMLRRVMTQSVSGLEDIGSLQINSDTVLFDINQSVAKVSLPKDLIKQLEN